MKYRKENAAAFEYELNGSSKTGANKKACRPSNSLEEYIERELKIEAEAPNRGRQCANRCGLLRAFALN